MKPIKLIYPARRGGKTKHDSVSNFKDRVRPALRSGFVVLALWVVSESNSNANSLPSLPKDLRRQGVQVWLKKGEHKLNLDSKGVILKGYDTVAYFTQKKAVKGSPKFQTTYEGAIYYFSSAADLAAFKKSPSKYAPQYGGFCANGMANKQSADIDPSVFFVLKGKLYVCASPEAEKEFQSNVPANVQKADQNWEDQYRWFY